MYVTLGYVYLVWFVGGVLVVFKLGLVWFGLVWLVSINDSYG